MLTVFVLSPIHEWFDLGTWLRKHGFIAHGSCHADSVALAASRLPIVKPDFVIAFVGESADLTKLAEIVQKHTKAKLIGVRCDVRPPIRRIELAQNRLLQIMNSNST